MQVEDPAYWQHHRLSRSRQRAPKSLIELKRQLRVAESTFSSTRSSFFSSANRQRREMRLRTPSTCQMDVKRTFKGVSHGQNGRNSRWKVPTACHETVEFSGQIITSKMAGHSILAQRERKNVKAFGLDHLFLFPGPRVTSLDDSSTSCRAPTSVCVFVTHAQHRRRNEMKARRSTKSFLTRALRLLKREMRFNLIATAESNIFTADSSC